MLKFRESILAGIHAKNLRPRPRWQYILLHTSLWCVGILTVILGSIAFAFVMLELTLPERTYIRWMEMQGNQWVTVLPYLWGIGSIVAVTLGYFIFKQTGKSYRFRAGMIVGILLAGSLLGGEMLYASRMVHWGDKKMQRFAPGYGQFREKFTRMIPRPEEGNLVIRVSEISTRSVIGISPDNQVWTVHIVCQSEECRERQKNISLQKPIIFEGKVVGFALFEASDILPRPKRPPLPFKKGLFLEKEKFQSDNGSGKKAQ